MTRLISPIIANTLGLWLAVTFVQGARIQVLPDSVFFGFPLKENWQVFLILALALTILNYFLKPVLDLITLPLKILTLGVMGLIINMGMIWVLTLIFREITFNPFLIPLFWTTVIIWGSNLIAGKIIKK